MSVKIGHASADENGNITGGWAGDNSGKEVCTRDWYNRSKGWHTVFRPKESATAEKIAKAMEQACANNAIGYDQSQRTTLYTYAKAANWDLSKIKSYCECDCSSLVAVCVNAAGIQVSSDMYTGSQKSILADTSKFELLTESKYLTQQDYLRRGDIILGQGHTAIVLSNGDLAVEVSKPAETLPEETAEALKVIQANDSAKNFKSSLAGKYKTTTKLNIRHGASTTKKIMVTVPKDTPVRCYGYYTHTSGTNWLYVQFTYNNTQYTGFASARYLVK